MTEPYNHFFHEGLIFLTAFLNSGVKKLPYYGTFHLVRHWRRRNLFPKSLSTAWLWVGGKKMWSMAGTLATLALGCCPCHWGLPSFLSFIPSFFSFSHFIFSFLLFHFFFLSFLFIHPYLLFILASFFLASFLSLIFLSFLHPLVFRGYSLS